MASAALSARVVTQLTEQRLVAGIRAGDELLAAISLVTSAYHLDVRWCDEETLDDLAAALTPRLASRLVCETPPRYVLVYGDPLRNTIYLSRRVLRLFLLRARHPVILEPLSSRSIREVDDAQRAPHGQSAYGPVARLAVYQADALLAVSARMALDVASDVSLASPLCYVVTAPRSLAETSAVVAGGVLGRVLALRRAPDTAYTHLMTALLPLPSLPAQDHQDHLLPAATGDSGPLTRA